jgi:hypothetical protein
MARRNGAVKAAFGAWAVCFGMGLAGRTLAQEVDSNAADQTTTAPNVSDTSSYDRGRNVSVLQRSRPDYTAVGFHVSDFTIFPKVDVSLNYDDNIYDLQSGAVGDAIVTAIPEIDVQSNWSRNAVSGRVWAQQDWYAKYSSEDAVQYGGDLTGRFDFGQSTLTGEVLSGQHAQLRSALINIGGGFPVHRAPFDTTELNAQLAHEFTRLRLSARVDYQINTYQNGETSAGAVVVYKDLNHQTLNYGGKAELAVSADTAVYVTAGGNSQQYVMGEPAITFTRNSSGYEVDAGLNFDLTRLLRGELQVGYLSQTFVSPLFKPISGPSAQGQLEWFLTQLTTVTVQASRSVADAMVPNAGGFLASNAKLEVDHELLRNLILSANAWIGQDQYNGIDRTDDRHSIGLSANWLFNRWVGLTFAYNYSDQRSSGVAKGPSYNDNRGSIATVLQF